MRSECEHRSLVLPGGYHTRTTITKEWLNAPPPKEIENGPRGAGRKRLGCFESHLSVPSKVNRVWPEGPNFRQVELFAVIACQ